MDVGINLTGGEYYPWVVTGAVEGVHYRYPSHQQIDYYAANGMSVVRLSVLWERMQANQNGPLDSHHLAQVKDIINYATSLGIKVELDVHNYGSAFGNAIGSAGTPISSFADLWGKLASEFKDNPEVVFGLMNEPNAQSATQWLPAINAAIDAIRDAGATSQMILVSGAYWDGAADWLTTDNAAVIGRPGAIVDPFNNYAIEVHQYLDDTSGQHPWVVSDTIGIERLTPITQWAEQNGVKLFLGEFGMANNSQALSANAKMLAYMDAHSDVWIGATYIGGGWQTTQSYMFSAEPDLGLMDTPQMDVLKPYLETLTRTVETDGGTLVYLSAPDGTGPQLVSQFDSRGSLIARYQLNAAGEPVQSVYLNDDGAILRKTYAAGYGEPNVEIFSEDFQLLASLTTGGNGEPSFYYYAPSGTISGQDLFDHSGSLTQRIYFNLEGQNCWLTYDNGVVSTCTVYNQSWIQLSRSTYDKFGFLTSGPGMPSTPTFPALSWEGLSVLADPPPYLPGVIDGVLLPPENPPGPEPEPPAPPLVLSGFDAGEAGVVPLKGTITLNFNQAVIAGSGQIIVHNADGSVAAVIAASSAVISGQTVTIKLPAGLLGGTSYYLELGADAFTSGSVGAAAALGNLALEFRTEMVQVSGTASANTLNGTAGGDLITGLAGNDKLFGLAGDDTINGGAGADIMTGGKGNDIYAVDVSTDKVVELANEGTDEVRASITYTLAANVENLTLTGTAAINGTGTGTANVLTGNGAANTLSGLGGADTLYGMGGNDRLDGGAGADLMFGGAGDDTYVVDSLGDQVTELAGEGTDTVLSSVSFTLGDNVENLTLTGTAPIIGMGNAGNNVLVGNASANTLIGGDGNDKLDGGLGNDLLIGGTGNDAYVVNSALDVIVELFDEGTDTVQSAVTYALGLNLENLTLTGTATINGTGNGLDNMLRGNGAANVLNGGGGSDWLAGGLGKDKLTGGIGTDFFVFDTAPSGTNADTITDFKAGEDKIVLDRAIFAALGAGVEADEFAIGAKALSGAVHLFYNSATGVLSYDVDGSGRVAAQQVAILQPGLALTASDFMVLDTKAAGAFAGALAASAASAVAEAAPVAKPEAIVPEAVAPELNVIKGGSGNDTLAGTAGADQITGFAGNDVLHGNDGDDWLNGRAGTDTLTGGAGADTFVFDTPIAKGNIDRITDFAVGEDRISLGRDIFSALGDSIDLSEFAIGNKATDVDTHLIYNSTTGALYYDADGSGRGAMQQFATLQNGLHLTSADFLIA